MGSDQPLAEYRKMQQCTPDPDSTEEEETPDPEFQIESPPPWIWVIPFLVPWPGNPLYGGL